MFSILIPTYNYNCYSFVEELHKQCVESGVDFEIIVMDDCSIQKIEENKWINKLPHASYIELDENVGRARIRNLLAEKANYENLLFIDGDARIVSRNFINRYLSFRRERNIVVGGIIYDSNEKNPRYSLRLKYGRNREASAWIKNNPVFTTFNFLIDKDLFLNIRFDESIQSYGHEDTIFKHQLLQKGNLISYIDNPLIHDGLDENHVFILKTKESVKNLSLLYQTGNYPFLSKELRLLHFYGKIKKLHLQLFAASFYKQFHRAIERNLQGKSPSLFLFDLYKLSYLAHCLQKK